MAWSHRKADVFVVNATEKQPMSNQKLHGWDCVIVGIVLALITGSIVACNQVVYGDWRCAFAECRIEKQ
jgi:hypothetical protein